MGLTPKHVTFWIAGLDVLFSGYVSFVSIYEWWVPEFSGLQSRLAMGVMVGILALLVIHGWLLYRLRRQLGLKFDFTTSMIVMGMSVLVVVMPGGLFLFAAGLTLVPIQGNRLYQRRHAK